MSIRVVALVRDCGDGSCGLHWFTNIEKAQAILDDQGEQYGVNEGSFAVDLKLPDGTDLAAAGIHVDDEDRGDETIKHWKGIKIKSLPATRICGGCLGETANWHDDAVCQSLPECSGIIWVKDE